MKERIDIQQLQKYGHLELMAKHAVEGFITGLHKSPFHGFSVEFAEHRLYNKGESTKHIDWKLFGRTDKLFVKRYEEETNLRCQIVIDNSSSMYYPYDEKDSSVSNKMSFSVYCAAALVELLKKQRDAVGLSIFSEDIELHTSAKLGQVHHRMLFSELEKLLHLYEPKQAHQKTFAVDALHQIAEATHKRSLVVIFSDMMDSQKDTDAMFHALNHLRFNKHEVILFHVVDKETEIDFDFANRPYEFIDMESGEHLKVNAADVKQNYIEALQKFRKELSLRCSQYHIDFVEANISETFDKVLTAYLVKRMKMI